MRFSVINLRFLEKHTLTRSQFFLEKCEAPWHKSNVEKYLKLSYVWEHIFDVAFPASSVVYYSACSHTVCARSSVPDSLFLWFNISIRAECPYISPNILKRIWAIDYVRISIRVEQTTVSRAGTSRYWTICTAVYYCNSNRLMAQDDWNENDHYMYKQPFHNPPPK